LGNVSFCSARRALVGNEINKNKMGKTQLNEEEEEEGSAAAAAAVPHTAK
jgi:hypothetical protein